MRHEQAEERARHEIEHGALLASENPEVVWGWGTLAGRLRAARRGQLIAEAAGLAEGQNVLEVGCGSGLFTSIFAESGASILAVDISEDVLRLARQRIDLSQRVRFACQRLEDADVDGPFDAVVGSSVLHHLEVDTALARIHALLKDGGVLAFAEPNLLNP